MSNRLLSACVKSSTALFALAVLSVIVGCAEKPNRLALHPTSGVVQVSGAAVAGVEVTLNPSKATSDAVGALRPHGVTDASGKFSLTTYVANDGAPEGDWMVTLRWPNTELPEDVRKKIESDGDAVPDRLEGQFSIPENSPWKVKTGASNSQIPTIDLP